MNDADSHSYQARTNRSQRSISVDNFMRKSLRVSDPRNPEQIASALLARYPEEAARDRAERGGFGYSTLLGAAAVPIFAQTGTVELETARSDLERDLQTLTTLSQLKDITVELTGWGRAIRRAAVDGLASARLALDSVSRDTALSARRTLADYARLARYVGAMSDGSGMYFRRLAQSCDVLGALILVAIGDGLAASGITRSTALVRVSGSELQTRRNAVISGLRGLTGSVDASIGQSEYPRGIVGYQMLISALENSGQADLRALLEENALASAMDQMCDLTTGASIHGLRELSTTAAMLTHRFTRLAQYCRSVPVGIPAAGKDYGTPESPPLLSFGAALQLFVDAFSGSGSSRLLYIARPPILAYGLYSNSDNVPADRLMRLTIARGNLAHAIDCFAGCGCDSDGIRCIVLLDFVLAQLDRAIDLYAVGTDPAGRGGAERRAVAAGLLADNAVHFIQGNGGEWNAFCSPGIDVTASVDAAEVELVDPFGGIGALDTETVRTVLKDLSVTYHSERQTEQLVRRLAAGCAVSDVFTPRFGANEERADSIVRLLIRRTFITAGGKAAQLPLDETINLPPTRERSGASNVYNQPYYEQL